MCPGDGQAAALPSGNRRRAWAVDVARPGEAPRPLFLRFASEPNAPDDPYDLRREARLYRALAGTPVLLPRLVGEHPAHAALLLERVAGRSDFRSLAQPDATQVARNFMRALHMLHSLDAGPRGLGSPGSIGDRVREELHIWRTMYESTQWPDALLELAFRWLAANVPEPGQPPVVVHGDAGPGNFIFAEGRLAALVDWELWHLGDPVEDIAWLSMRSVLEPIPQFAQRVREYEALRGESVDRARLDYHRVFVTARVSVIRHRALADPSPDSDPGNSLVSRLVNRRLLVKSLRGAMRVAPAARDLPDPPPTPRTTDYDYLLGQLRDVVAPAVTDPVASRRIKGMARVLKHLREQDRRGAAFERQEREDLARVLGTQCRARTRAARNWPRPFAPGASPPRMRCATCSTNPPATRRSAPSRSGNSRVAGLNRWRIDDGCARTAGGRPRRRRLSLRLDLISDQPQLHE